MRGRKRSASSRGRDGHVGAPPKRNAPQETANEVAPLTHNDIPRIIQGFVQSLSDISAREEPTPRDRTAVSTRSTGTRPQTPIVSPPDSGEQIKDHNVKMVDRGAVAVLGRLLKRAYKESRRE